MCFISKRNSLCLTETSIPKPVFSEVWQFSEQFSSHGGQLQGPDSDVILSIPETAINDISDKESSHGVSSSSPSPSDITSGIKSNDSEKQDVTTGVTDQNDQVAKGVRIYGAISTDLETVQRKLRLASTETISSPVAEYFAGENFTFHQPVCISLPHFLPPDINTSDVRVYQFHTDNTGEIVVERLTLSKPNDNTPEERSDEPDSSIADDVVKRTGVFYFSEKGEINILTDHFSGYLCTQCKQELDPPHLRLRLYGRHIQRNTRDVDLTLFIWDRRLDIRDFRKVSVLFCSLPP